jgi:hypothetical protein
MDATGKARQNTHPNVGNAPAIARYFDSQQIAGFQAELSLICQQRRDQFQILTAKEINEQAARILARAAKGAQAAGPKERQPCTGDPQPNPSSCSKRAPSRQPIASIMRIIGA